jgi:hypothetical protein
MSPYQPEPVYGDTEFRHIKGPCEGCERIGPLALVRLESCDSQGRLYRRVQPTSGFCVACSRERALARGESMPDAAAAWLDELDDGLDEIASE